MGSRLQREARTVSVMIRHYCRDHHGGGPLCPECRELDACARERLGKCPFGDGKTTCARCPVHCYRPEMRARIRTVMRYAGPRMLLWHPVMAVRHLLDGRRREPIRKTEEP
jgi:hypothetical protein